MTAHTADSFQSALVLLLCLAAVISGCATSQVPALVESLNAETPCCSTYTEFDFDEIAIEEEFRFSIAPGDQVYEFPSGRSYFKAYRLPSSAGPGSMIVETYMIGPYWDSAHIFAPVLTFLDETHTPVSVTGLSGLKYDRGLFENPSFIGFVEIPPGAIYVVFHTAPELFYQTMAVPGDGGFAYYSGTGTVFVPATGDRRLPIGPSGTLKVTIVPEID